MKKLMIAAAIVCATACSHGAALLWQWAVSGAASTIMDAEPHIVGNTTAFFFANYADEETMYAAADGVIASLRASKGDTSVLTPTQTGDIGANGKMAEGKILQSDAFGTNDKNYMFTVIVAEDAAGNKWAAINDLAKKGAAVGGTAMNFSYSGFDEDYIYAGLTDNYTSAEGAGWFQLTEGATPTPEPTSGLLLLLGVAGLALRRRRA